MNEKRENFIFEDSPEGGYLAKAAGESIFIEADTHARKDDAARYSQSSDSYYIGQQWIKNNQKHMRSDLLELCPHQR